MVVGNDRGGPLSIEHLVHCLHIRDSHSHSASWKLTTQYSHCSTSYLEVQSNLQINPIGYLPLKIFKRNFFNESTIIRIIRCKKLRLHIVLGHGKMRPMKPLPKVRPAFVALHQRGRSSSSSLELARLCGDYGLALLKRPPNTASKLSLKPHFFIQLSEQREILESAITLPLYIPQSEKNTLLTLISFPQSLSLEDSSFSLQCFLIIPKIFCYGVFTAFKKQ